jgi:4-hydroxy-tetrahydrodipicolinate synthase
MTEFPSSSASARFRGVLAPALTPFKADLSPDPDAFLRFCRWLLENGAQGLAVFGTTSEANSLTVSERQALLEHLVGNGIDPALLMPGTGACALPDAITLTRHALGLGAGGVLVLPPFYYKNVPEDGIFAYYAGLIEAVGSPGLQLYLYHIPQMSGVALTPALIARLLTRYGPVIAGLKDSSGVWDNVTLLLREFPDLALFPASEKFLLPALRLGAAGCISATANFQPGNIRRLIDLPEGDARTALEVEVGRIRGIFEQYPLVPALKAAQAARTGDAIWRTVRPPLAPLPEPQRAALLAALGGTVSSAAAV